MFGTFSYSQAIHSKNPIKDQYIIVLKKGHKPNELKLWQTIKNREKKSFTEVLNGFSMHLSKGELKQLANEPAVDYIEEDTAIHISGSEVNPPIGLDRIDQTSLPLNSIYNYQYLGTGVTVFVMDTGINFAHVDFGGRASNGIDNVGDGQNGNDCNGHGTHVAGIIGGSTYGVAKGVTLKALRVLNCSASGAISNMIAAADWAAVNKTGPSIMNISLEFAGLSPSLETSLANVKAKGILLVVAAGNESSDACNYSPAASVSAMAVGATDASSDQRWLGSNTGSCVDIWAPGLFIVSDWVGSTTATNSTSGTSMSSPHVAGVAALYLENAPLDGVDFTKNFLTSVATPNAIQNADTGSPNLLLYSGFTVTPYTVPTCSGQQYDGYLNQGTTVFFPSDVGFSGGTGTYTGSVFAGNGLQFSLALWVKRGNNWASTQSGNNPITYHGKSGTYRWSITGNSGSAGYRLCTTSP